MGDKKKAIFKNSSMGFLSQLVTMLLTFVTRSLFIKYIGVELLGLNSTFSSVLTTLSLAELGIQSAIVYNLYKPLHDENYQEVNSIMNILKMIYRGVGIFFVTASLLVTPLLKYIVTEIEINSTIYIYFWLQALASACTYFLAYKRAILYADQKDYVSKTIDLVFSIIFNFLQWVSLIVYKSYLGYLILRIAQTYGSNIIVSCYCKVHYNYLCKVKIDFEKLKKIIVDVRDIFSGRIASFVYNSTDNLIISAFVSTISVGYLANYTTITISLKTLTNCILSPLIPILGNHLLDEKDNRKREELFFLNTFVRFIISLMVVIPTTVLIDDFITAWVGASMVLDKSIVILLCIDFYIHVVHSATIDFINSAGLFKTDKYVEILGAFCNASISLLLVRFCGIEGVFIGTVISQMIFWIGRSVVVYKQCLHLKMNSYRKYVLKNLLYVIVAVGFLFVTQFIHSMLPISNAIVRFIVGGIVCEVVIMALGIIIFYRSHEMQMLRKIICSK